ncbi:hypothetical protein ACFSUJ_34430, partial [Streptomyces lusitanus]|uniref:hypothetical protein n=1 Tax=Streptomyces lusitanus TaxID=68232 RepID=UPI00363ADA3F
MTATPPVPRDDWRYEVAWAPASGAVPPVEPARWLVLATTGHPWAEALRERGFAVADSWDAADTGGGRPGVDGVLSLLALDEEPHPDHPVLPGGPGPHPGSGPQPGPGEDGGRPAVVRDQRRREHLGHRPGHQPGPGPGVGHRRVR